MPPEKLLSTDCGDRGYEVRILGVYGVTWRSTRSSSRNSSRRPRIAIYLVRSASASASPRDPCAG